MGIDIRYSPRCNGTKAGPRRSLLAQATSPVADGCDVARHLLIDHVLEAWIERPKVRVRREAITLRPDRLVAGGAAVTGLMAGQLPDHPVGGFDQAARSRIQFRCLAEDLE